MLARFLGGDYEEATVLVAVLLALLAARRHFTRRAGAFAAPLQKMAGLLQALPRNMAYGLSALLEKRRSEGPAPAAGDEAPAPAPAAEAEAPEPESESPQTETSEQAEGTE